MVIAILGLLMTILLPSLSKARAKGMQTVCLSNIKQSSLAVINYSLSNNSWGPSENGSDNGNKWFDKLIPSYLPEGEIDNGCSKVNTCPSGTDITKKSQSTLGLNAFISGKDTEETNWKAEQVSLIKAHRPSETSMFVDSFKTWRSIGYSIVSSGNTLNSDSTIRIARHNLKANVSFVDGHAKALSAQQLISKKSQRTFSGIQKRNEEFIKQKIHILKLFIPKMCFLKNWPYSKLKFLLHITHSPDRFCPAIFYIK